MEASLRIKQREIEGMGKPSLQKMYGDLMKDVCAYVQICVLSMRKRDKRKREAYDCFDSDRDERNNAVFFTDSHFCDMDGNGDRCCVRRRSFRYHDVAKKNSPTLQQYLLTRQNSKLAATAETVKAGISVTISTVQAFVKYLGEDVNQFVCGELDVGDTVSLNVSSSKAEKTI